MHLKRISKLSNEVTKLELDARDAAKHMEEAFTKAQIAKSKMITVNLNFSNIIRQAIRPKWWQVQH